MYKVGIIGLGFVGGATSRAFAQYADVKVYDKFKNIGTLKEVADQSIVFVCVPTPMLNSGECDTSIVESVIKELNGIPNPDREVVIKSTCPPQFFKRMQDMYPYAGQVVFNPEFLTERTADLDFIQSSRFIFGVEFPLKRAALRGNGFKVEGLFKHRFPGTPLRFMNWEEAALVKYGCNVFFTVKLSFFNELALVAKKLNMSFPTIINEILQDGRIGRSHFQVPGHDGDKGWGGVCFPKDNRAFSAFAKELLVNSHMTDAAWQVNQEVRTDRNWEKEVGRAVSEEKV
jgi:UDPglucose 6-dehydrogenase